MRLYQRGTSDYWAVEIALPDDKLRKLNGLPNVVSAKWHMRVLRAHRDAKLGAGKAKAAALAEPDFFMVPPAA